MYIKVAETTLLTPLGHYIGVTTFLPKITNNKSIVISSATGVLQKYYAKFSTYFASIGYTVYTFDYHGIGKSGSDIESLKQNTSTLKDWGNNDQASVLGLANKENPKSSLTLLTHSVGGQVFSLNAKHHLVDNVVMIASQGGYWKDWKGLQRIKMYLYWHAMIPWVTPLFNYFPAKKMGLFENLPKKAVYQWSNWGKKKEYMLSEYDKKDTFFDAVTCAMLIMSFPRDFYAPKKNVDWLASHFSNAKIDRQHIMPEEIGIPDVKHFGFFRDTYKDSLWKSTHDWIVTNTR